jgi:hypothetical protein
MVSRAGLAQQWDIKAQTKVAEVKIHQGAIRSVAFSSDGGKLITTSEDGTADYRAGSYRLLSAVSRAGRRQFLKLLSIGMAPADQRKRFGVFKCQFLV